MPTANGSHRPNSKGSSRTGLRTRSARTGILSTVILALAVLPVPSVAASPPSAVSARSVSGAGLHRASSESPVVAKTWTELDAAFTAGTSVGLGADITAPNGAFLTYTGTGRDANSDLNAITLDLGGHHLAITDVDDGHAAIGVRASARLYITDTAGGGQLVAVGGRYAAGIGGSGSADRTPAANSGDIYIEGASVTATGGDHGAGIGGGMGGSVGGGNRYDSIYIVDRSWVVAAGTNGGAGIGSGDSINGVAVPTGYINLWRGSVVVATGGADGAGIGGGRSSRGATVYVSTAASVKATGGEDAAGVGGGAFAAGGLVTVGSQGTLTAQGGSQGAGIGGGFKGDGGSSWTLQDGSVTAISGPDAGAGPGSAIGAGSLGVHPGELRIYGKLTIPAGSDLVLPAPADAFSYGGFIRVDGRLLGTGTLRNRGWIIGDGVILAGGAGNLQITGHNYVLTYDPNGGQLHGPRQLTVYACSVYDSRQHVPYATKAGPPYGHFLGWYTGPVGGTRITSTTSFCSGALPTPHDRLHPAVLYAHWSS